MPGTGLPCGLPVVAVNLVDVQIIVGEVAAAEGVVAVCAGLTLPVDTQNHAVLSVVGVAVLAIGEEGALSVVAVGNTVFRREAVLQVVGVGLVAVFYGKLFGAYADGYVGWRENGENAPLEISLRVHIFADYSYFTEAS